MDLTPYQAKRLAAVLLAEGPERGAIGWGVGRSRRILARAALCLGLGFVTTVAVAWVSATTEPAQTSWRWNSVYDQASDGFVTMNGQTSVYRSPVAHREMFMLLSVIPTEGVPPPSPEVALARHLAPCLAASRRKGGFPPAWGEVTPHQIGSGTPDDYVNIQDARGFPLLALRCEWRKYKSALGFVSTGAIQLADAKVFQRRAGWGLRGLPYRPIPLGLTVDTLLFAALWSLILFAPGSLRRYIRRRRNLCPRCGYSRVGLAVDAACPECGMLLD